MYVIDVRGDPYWTFSPALAAYVGRMSNALHDDYVLYTACLLPGQFNSHFPFNHTHYMPLWLL